MWVFYQIDTSYLLGSLSCEHMIEYVNSSRFKFVKGRRCTECRREDKYEQANKDKYIFPVVLDKVCYDFEFDVVDCKN